MRKLVILLLGATALMTLVSLGCGTSNPTNPTFSDPDAVEPTAGTWMTWVIPSGSSYRPVAPPGSADSKNEINELKTFVSQRTDAVKAYIDYWNGGNARRWNELQRALIAQRKVNPPRASRGLALVSVAMYDAMVAAWDAKYHYNRARPYDVDKGLQSYGTLPISPSYVSERAAMGAAASDLLKYLFPDDADTINGLFAQAKNADLYSGIHYRSDVVAGEQIGHAVSATVIVRAQTDNSDATFTGTEPTGPGYWEPTPPALVQSPLEPACGKWKTWILPNGQTLRPGAPPAYGSAEFNEQTREVWDINQNLTNERLNIANFWADGSGTATPPGHWNQIAVDLAASEGMNEPRTARMLALLGAAQADAFIACWDCKYVYWCVRPITEIRKTYNSTWLSPVVTPPFPSFPSGHSATSGAAATVLGYIFPNDAEELQRKGVEAMNSRLYGGIHYPFDNLTGFNMGVAIATRAIRVGQADGSPRANGGSVNQVAAQ